MTGKADWSALNGIPFVDRILSFEDFCQLIPNEDFYLHFSKSKKPLPMNAKQLNRDFDVLTKILTHNMEPITSQSIEGYELGSLLIMHSRKLYKVYSAESMGNDNAVIKQWDFSLIR